MVYFGEDVNVMVLRSMEVEHTFSNLAFINQSCGIDSLPIWTLLFKHMHKKLYTLEPSKICKNKAMCD